MKQKAKQLGYLFFILVLLGIPFEIAETDKTNLSATISQTPTLSQVLEKRKKYTQPKPGRSSKNKLVNILIVPGHDDEHWGAEFKGVKEVELNRMLGQKLYEYLSNEEGINPVLVSTDSGYSSIFETYFKKEKNKIENFIEDSKEKFTEKVSAEEFDDLENNFHNVAPDEVREKLYGINSWINSQKFDFVIHIHFNDYPGRKWNKPGKYDGFSIYTPGTLFDNHDLSRTLADSVYEELKKVRPVSNLEEEQEGVIEDHELIALGANESLNAGSILIEYGYIYEPIFTNTTTRETSLDYFAYATYAGIKNMLREVPQEKEKLEVAISKDKTSKDNLVWQFQKTFDGIYPPQGKTLRDCPITGYFGDCSRKIQ